MQAKPECGYQHIEEGLSAPEDSSCHFDGDLDGSESHANANANASTKTNASPIAKTETKNVNRLKYVLLVVLVSSAVLVGGAVYFFTTNIEETAFKNHFSDSSDKLVEAVGSTLDVSLSTVDTFLVGLVSFAKSSGTKFPYVTLPDYATRVAKVRALSKAVIVSQYHYVPKSEREQWESYSLDNDGWVDESLDVQRNDTSYKGKHVDKGTYPTNGIIHTNQADVPPDAPGPFLPVWQQSPVIPYFPPYNWDGLSYFSLADAQPALLKKRAVLGPVGNYINPNDPYSKEAVDGYNAFVSNFIGPEVNVEEPFSGIFYPILDSANVAVQPGDGNVVGVFTMSFFWRDLLRNSLPPGSNGVVVVINTGCNNQEFTYQIDGPLTTYLGQGDRSDPKYRKSGKTVKLNERREGNTDFVYTGLPLSDEYCVHTISIYPSKTMSNLHQTNRPIYYTIVAVAIFFFTSIVFLSYDFLVDLRQQKVMKTAERSSAIVSDLFPSNVRDRLYPKEEDHNGVTDTTKGRLQSFLKGNHSTMPLPESVPIADLFPETTVLMSDIVGFTKWSSSREPSQVFKLLEALYGAFDSIAIRRGVFKVETIGDAYLAVCGLPEPRQDHAVVMTKFSHDCRQMMREVVHELSSILGDDTSRLNMRIGLHSGPVTAGVLRGQRSRFQLFGDTVNTAARMESNGVPNKIQVSEQTAEQLRFHGKGSWLKARKDLVSAKGKGDIQTYFVEPHSTRGSSNVTPSTNGDSAVVHHTPVESISPLQAGENEERLISMNEEILGRLLRKVLACRGHSPPSESLPERCDEPAESSRAAIDEVKDMIIFDQTLVPDEAKFPALDGRMKMQLRAYIGAIARLHNDNAFHNFQHASHVSMSAMKLLSRIIAPQDGHSGSIATDPLAQFAIVFSALIHDCSHPGVSNQQLSSNRDPLAIKYQDRSVGEQNSIDVAWSLFLQNEYKLFREMLCPTEHELLRFRQLVINCVIATDILDADLIANRQERWEGANADRSTIVMELLLQASDIAHTMQHWDVYVKWNGALYREMGGGNGKDWYFGELDFFDKYVIPLANKMKECGVFGASGDECLTYAKKNREEWARKGQTVIAGYKSVAPFAKEA